MDPLRALQADLAALDWSDAGAALFVDWGTFWSKDRSAPEWLYEDVLARGRGHAIYAKHGTGKSLFALWMSMELVKAGHVVVYGDWEMGEDDLFERLSDMGYGPETDLSRLRYLLLPNLAPLNTAEGAQEFCAILDEVQAAWPECHLAVVIDTIGRAVVGEENSNDTIQDFYRHTGLGLKQRGATWVRLDHAGHEGTHARGGSAKGDDVDVVWRLAATDDGIELRCDKRRMGWVPEKVTFKKISEPVLRYEKTAEIWPAGTDGVAQLLDSLGVRLGASTREAQEALTSAGAGKRREVLLAGLRYRRMTADIGREPPPEPPLASDSGTTSGTTPRISHNHGAEPPPEPVGTAVSEPLGTAGGVPLGTPRVPAPISDSSSGHRVTPGNPLELTSPCPDEKTTTKIRAGVGGPSEGLVGILLDALRDGSMSPDVDSSRDAPEVRAAWAKALRLHREAQAVTRAAVTPVL